MSDKELLELAAKAASVELKWTESGKPYTGVEPFNPLTDDGDALRLAARLNFRLDIHGGTVRIVDELDNEHYLSGVVTDSAEQMSVVRRAIARAAAEIGRNLS